MAFPVTKPTVGLNGYFVDANFQEPAVVAGQLAAYLAPGSIPAITYAATINPDFVTNGRVQSCTLTGALTVGSPTNQAPLAGTFYTLVLIQDGTGGRTITYSGTMKGTGGVATVTTASTYTIDTFLFDGTNYRLQFRVTGQVA